MDDSIVKSQITYEIFNNTNITIVSNTTHTNNVILLVLDLVIFIVLTYLSYSYFTKYKNRNINPEELQQNNNTDNGNSNFKTIFTGGLMYSNGSRALSLIFIIALKNNTDNSFTGWLNFLAHVLPAILFLSTYIEVVAVLADIYYSRISYENHLVKPILSMVSKASYYLIGILAFFTLRVGYCLMGLAFMYFGEKLSEMYNNTTSNDPKSSFNSHNSSNNNQLGKQIILMSFSIGGLFLIKGLTGVLPALGAFDDVYPSVFGPNLWDFLMFLITEILPTLIFLGIAKYFANNAANNNSDGMELNDIRRDSQASNIYEPPSASQSFRNTTNLLNK